MRKVIIVSVSAVLTAFAAAAFAHHSFAVYDMETEIEFFGVVETLEFRNPHMAMTLVETQENGDEKVINFVEGAPANMLVRMGFDPAVLEPGKTVRVVGSPRKDNPDAFFLKKIYLEDGTEFNVLGGNVGGRE